MRRLLAAATGLAAMASAAACAQDLGPCDLIQGGCVAAHSTMRSLLTTYKGPLFQLTDDRAPLYGLLVTVHTERLFRSTWGGLATAS
jgi:hypothetical protein